MKVSGKTRICGIVGDPIEHSLSPVMHNAALEFLKLDFIYVAFKVKTSELENAMRGVRSLGIHGLNVTMPHKLTVINYLDAIDEEAKAIGSVNTVLNVDGKLMGFNTDGIGAVDALKNNQVKLKGSRVMLLGAGGAARAIAFHLAQETEEVIIINRTGEKARQLAEFLRRTFNKNVLGETLSLHTLEKWLADADILINATSIGMFPNVNQTLVKPEWLNPELVVMDTVYTPFETKLIRDAKATGAKVIHGVDMLVYQGAASFKIWFGREAPIEVMKKAVLKNLHRRCKV